MNKIKAKKLLRIAYCHGKNDVYESWFEEWLLKVLK